MCEFRLKSNDNTKILQVLTKKYIYHDESKFNKKI